ncbi:mas-related G-protein coupled receptor member X2-like, partial [Carlito syrichta]|uniref:Mas-related G-protein coupled receptor member X2-like n=1 Tax=Carlito syrichta TaxID=1868482 RepID=A0A3Q0DUJ2_CARSF
APPESGDLELSSEVITESRKALLLLQHGAALHSQTEEWRKDGTYSSFSGWNRANRRRFPSMDSTIPQWKTELTQINETALRIPSPACDVQNLIEILLMLIIALVGLAGNGIVLWLLGFCMRRNAFSTYVLNLAAADFLFLCGQMIRSLLQLISNFDFIYSISSPVIVFPYLAGLSILSTISIERCLSVLWPIWYRCRRPRHMSAVVCALLWPLSLLLSILEV